MEPNSDGRSFSFTRTSAQCPPPGEIASAAWTKHGLPGSRSSGSAGDAGLVVGVVVVVGVVLELMTTSSFAWFAMFALYSVPGSGSGA